MYSVKSVLLQVGLLCFGLSLQAQVIYVKPGAHGNGSSWAQAMGDLHQALRSAKAGDQVWVAAGKYYTTRSQNRNASFEIPSGVGLYGGFLGHETSLEQRQIGQRPSSILSGEIGSPTRDDNAYTVVYTRQASESTVIDGFVITGGYSNGKGQHGDRQSCGAGWYNDGSHGASNPTIRNCVFSDNTARNGAGLYNYGARGEASPVIDRCQFVKNEADLDGGAIHNNGANGISNTRIAATQFIQNEATYGAAVFNTGEHGQAKPLISNCQFRSNYSFISGSGVYNFNKGQGICQPVIRGCLFEGNYATVGNEVGSNSGAAASNKSTRSTLTFRPGF